MHGFELQYTTVTTNSLWQEFVDEVITLLRAFGVELVQAPILSLYAIAPIYMIVFAGVLVWGASVLKKESFFSEAENEILLYLLAALSMLLFAASVTSLVSGIRYWAFIAFATAIVAVNIFRFLGSRYEFRALRILYCVFLVVGICISTANIYRKPPDVTSTMKVSEYLRETGKDRVAGTYWNVNIYKFLSNGKLKGNTIIDTETLPIQDWITDRTQYVNDDEPVTLILTQAEKASWTGNEKLGHLLTIADEVEEIDGYSLYSYSNNPLSFNLFEYGENARYGFLSLYYMNGAYLRDGKIVLPPGSTQYGPYRSLQAGTYEVVIRGENLTAGAFDAFVVDHTLELEDMTVGPEEVRYTLHVDEDLASVEYRCVNTSDTPVVIRDIMVFPRGVDPVWE